MNFQDVVDLMSYWAEVPPPHVALKQISMFLGGVTKGAEEAPKELMQGMQQSGQQGNIADLVAMFPGGNISVG